jgi:membrane associated rhomboid family serine protease
MFTLLIYILLYAFFAILGSFIPIGNENSTVRRLPWITFAIMAANVMVFFGTLPVIAGETKGLVAKATEFDLFVTQHEELKADKDIRRKLLEVGGMSKPEAELIEDQLKKDQNLRAEYDEWLRSSEAQELRKEFDLKLTAYTNVRKASFHYRYGLSPNGEWKIYQFITAAFLHAGYEHLFGNLIFFFAVAFTLEDLWGRGVFLSFYLLGAFAASLPYVIQPAPVPAYGASGAIAATMGAFLVRLPRTKIKLLFWPARYVVFLLGKKRPIVLIPGYIFLIAYFIGQIISLYFQSKSGSIGGTAYSVHIAGFIFGAGFAFMMKTTKYEETHINPKIEAKVSFEAPIAVRQGLELMDKGQLDMAERKLRSHLTKDRESLEAILGLIQVYEKTSNQDQLNSLYGRLIHYHLSKEDKEAALYAYDNLLSALPDNDMRVRIPVKDWMTICEYLREVEMAREAAVEFERLAKAWPDDPNAVKAYVQGAELALLANEPERAFRMFQMAEQMNPPQPFVNRIVTGGEKCKKILANRPDFKKKQNKPPVFNY